MGEIETHAATLKAWAGIALTRLYNGKPVHEGTLVLLRDLSDAMVMESERALRAARWLRGSLPT